MVIGEPATLLGFYNCPGITLEPLCRPVALAPGERWESTIFLGAFGGVPEARLAEATPLYVAPVALAHSAGPAMC